MHRAHFQCPYSTRWVGVYMSTVRTHSGHMYFAKMSVRFQYAGKWRWDVGRLSYAVSGATAPMWLFPPASTPYL
jgi:hypothetical protein